MRGGCYAAAKEREKKREMVSEREREVGTQWEGDRKIERERKRER